MATKRLVVTILAVWSSAALALSIAVAKGEAQHKNDIPICPQSYPVEGIILTKVPSGWRSDVRARFDLQSASVVEGDPERQGELVPEVVEKKGGDSIAIYHDINSNPKYEAWLSCNYGYGGEIRMFKKLPSIIHTCTMKYKYDKTFKMASIDTYSCS